MLLLRQSTGVPLGFAHGSQKAKGTQSVTGFSRTIPVPPVGKPGHRISPGRDEEVARILHPPPSHQHQVPKNKLHPLMTTCFLLFKRINKCDLRRLVVRSYRASSRLKSPGSSP